MSSCSATTSSLDPPPTPPAQVPNQEVGPENLLIPVRELAAEETEEFQLHGRRLLRDWQIGFVKPRDHELHDLHDLHDL